MTTTCLHFLGTNGMGLMMLGAGAFRLSTLALLTLAIAALVKYLRSDRRPDTQ